MLKFIALAVLTVFFFATADVAHAQGCPPPKTLNTAKIKCSLAYGATWQYDNRYGRCLWISPHQREMHDYRLRRPGRTPPLSRHQNSEKEMVGAAGFEPATPSLPDWYANRAALRSDWTGL